MKNYRAGINPSIINDPLQRRNWAITQEFMEEVTKALAKVVSPGQTPTVAALVDGTLGSTIGASFRDTLFSLYDDIDTTKSAVFQCSTISSGVERTYTFPDASGTLLLDTTIGTTAYSFSDALFSIFDNTTPGKIATFQLDGFGSVGTHTYRLPPINPTTTTLACLDLIQSFTVAQFFVGITLSNAGGNTQLAITPDPTQSVDIVSIMHPTAGFPTFRIDLHGAPIFNEAIDPSGVPLFWSGAPTVDGFYTFGDAVGGGSMLFMADAALTGSTQLLFPAVGGTVATLLGTQTLGNKTLNTTNAFNSTDASTGASFKDTTTATKRLRMILSTCSASTNTALRFNSTASRTIDFPDAAIIVSGSAAALTSGRVPFATAGGLLTDSSNMQFSTDTLILSKLNATQVYNNTILGVPVVAGDDPPAVASSALGKVDLLAQSANISSTNLSSGPPAGFYRISCVLEVTTSDAAAGTVTATFAWTDDVGATTGATAALALTATGRTVLDQVLYVASGNISYSTSHTGSFGTSLYGIHVRVEFLG